MIIVDVAIVNVAVPAIIADLGITSTTAQWVQEAYTLVFAALLLTWGRLADRVGRRRMLALGIAVFAAASVLAALAPTGGLLVLGRVLQGVGAAAVFPTTLSLINAGFRGRERATAFAVWGSTIGATAALGPLLGGWLTTEYSWRWAFGIFVPLSAVVVAGLLAFVEESREDDAAPGVDLGGALLSVAAAGLLVFGLIEGRTYGWWATTETLRVGDLAWGLGLSPVPVALVLAAVAAAVFVAWELRRGRAGRAVLLDVQLFAIPSFRNGTLAQLIVSLGEFGLLFGLPLWFQNVLGYSAAQTGLALLPLAIGSFLAGGAAAVLVGRAGALAVVRLGLAFEVVGIAGLGLVVAPDTSWWAPVPFLATYGFGVGLANSQLASVVLSEVPVAKSGQGSGTTETSLQIGSALGIAILGTVLFAGVAAGLDDRLTGGPLPPAEREQVVAAVRDTAGAAIEGLRERPGGAAVADAAEEAFSDATRYTAFTAAGFLVLGLLATLRLPSVRPRQEDEDGAAWTDEGTDDRDGEGAGGPADHRAGERAGVRPERPRAGTRS